jgi:hypothetical protein
MKVDFAVCSYLTNVLFDKNEVNAILTSQYKDRYSDMSVFAQSENQNPSQLLISVKDFMTNGYILNIFGAKVDILYNPQKNYTQLEQKVFFKGFDILDDFFKSLKYNNNIDRLSAMAIAKEEINLKQAKGIVDKISKISSAQTIEFLYKEVSRIENNNLITVIQINDPNTNDKSQLLKNFIISTEANNIQSQALAQKELDVLKSELVALLIENLKKQSDRLLNKKT